MLVTGDDVRGVVVDDGDLSDVGESQTRDIPPLGEVGFELPARHAGVARADSTRVHAPRDGRVTRSPPAVDQLRGTLREDGSDPRFGIGNNADDGQEQCRDDHGRQLPRGLAPAAIAPRPTTGLSTIIAATLRLVTRDRRCTVL